MKKSIKILTLGISLGMASLSIAQPVPPPPPPGPVGPMGPGPMGPGPMGPGPMGPGMMGRGIMMMDKDGDGKVSKEEFMQAQEERFKQMDRNGDGFIEPEEMGPGMMRPMPAPAQPEAPKAETEKQE